MKYQVAEIKEIIFMNKQNISWNDVEKYLKRYVGNAYVVCKYQNSICIAGDFPNEFSESKYTKKLRGALAKVKANAAQIVDLMIINAVNRRWMENRNDKHKYNASEGLFLYDIIDIKKEASTPLESQKTVR